MFANSLQENHKLHDIYMREILKDIFSHPLAQYLAFKGGTLAYMCYELDRFSTDIDIDLLDTAFEQQIIQVIHDVLVRKGDIKSFLVGKDLHRRIFRYDVRSMNIKVELNKRKIQHNQYEMLTIHNYPIQCMTSRSMVTNKLVALYNRFYNRDLYDIHFFLSKKYNFDDAIILERT
jgi:predicted nucleotidyltransferase component of viral defense system